MKSELKKVFDRDGTVLVAAHIDPSDIVVAKEEVRHGVAPQDGWNYSFRSPEFRYEIVPSDELVEALKELDIYDRIAKTTYFMDEERMHLRRDGCHSINVSFDRMRNQERKNKKMDKANKKLDCWLEEDKKDYLDHKIECYAEYLTGRIREVMSRRAHEAAETYIRNKKLDSEETKKLRSELDEAEEALEAEQRRVRELTEKLRNSKVDDRLKLLGELYPEVKDLLKEKMYNETRYCY